MGESNAHDMANAAWAFATVGQADASLFVALAKEAMQHLVEFNALRLANVA